MKFNGDGGGTSTADKNAGMKIIEVFTWKFNVGTKRPEKLTVQLSAEIFRLFNFIQQETGSCWAQGNLSPSFYRSGNEN